jgi:hypothetical protein
LQNGAEANEDDEQLQQICQTTVVGELVDGPETYGADNNDGQNRYQGKNHGGTFAVSFQKSEIPRQSVANLNQLGWLLQTGQFLARSLLRFLVGIGDEAIRAALHLRHQFFHDGAAGFFAQRISMNYYFEFVLAGIVFVIDLRLFGHLFSPSLAG